MKKLNVLFIFVIVFSMSNAQNYEVKDSQGNDITNSTHTIYGSSKIMEERWDVKNLTNDTVDLMLKRYEVSVVLGTKNYFCFGDCLSDEPAGKFPFREAFIPISLASNETEPSTYVYLRPEGNKGINKFLYVFYDNDNPNDSVWVDLIFDVDEWVGVNEVSSIDAELTAGPIPANDYININYNFNNVYNGAASIVVVDLLGKKHTTVNLENEKGTIRVNTSDLKAGIYFYALKIDDNTITTKKLVVN